MTTTDVYWPRKDEKLSWPELLRVNNLLKVITRKLSGTAGIWNLRPTDPETDTLTTEPPRLVEANFALTALA